MKILMITRYNPFTEIGGGETLVRNLSLELLKLGHKVSIIYGHPYKEGSKAVLGNQSVSEYAVDHLNLSFVGGLHFYFKMRQRLTKILDTTFDVAVFHDFTAAYAASGIWRNITIPFIYYAHDCARPVYDMLSFVPLRRRLKYLFLMKYFTFCEQHAFRTADIVIAISDAVKRGIHENYGVPLEKIATIYHGLPSNFTEGFETSDPKIPTFLHIATDHQRKGTKYLLDAARILIEKYGVKVKLVIVGKQDPYYVSMAKLFNVNANFVGYVSQNTIKELYATSTCLVIPSIREGFCLPVIEASSFGKPVIVTHAGALPELVKDGVDGFVVPVADVNSLSEKMYILATNRRLRKKMTLKAIEKAEKFGIDVTAKRFIDAINSTSK